MHGFAGLGIVGVAVGQHGLAGNVIDLEAEALVEAALEFELNTVVVRVPDGSEHVDGPVDLLVIRSGRHVGVFAGRQGPFVRRVPDIRRSRIVIRHPLLLISRIH